MRTQEEIKEKVASRYQARTPRGPFPRPDLIDPKDFGHHCSYVEGDYRYWGFVNEEGRTKFVLAFGSAEAWPK